MIEGPHRVTSRRRTQQHRNLAAASQWHPGSQSFPELRGCVNWRRGTRARRTGWRTRCAEAAIPTIPAKPERPVGTAIIPEWRAPIAGTVPNPIPWPISRTGPVGIGLTAGIAGIHQKITLRQPLGLMNRLRTTRREQDGAERDEPRHQSSHDCLLRDLTRPAPSFRHRHSHRINISSETAAAHWPVVWDVARVRSTADLHHWTRHGAIQNQRHSSRTDTTRRRAVARRTAPPDRPRSSERGGEQPLALGAAIPRKPS